MHNTIDYIYTVYLTMKQQYGWCLCWYGFAIFACIGGTVLTIMDSKYLNVTHVDWAWTGVVIWSKGCLRQGNNKYLYWTNI